MTKRLADLAIVAACIVRFAATNFPMQCHAFSTSTPTTAAAVHVPITNKIVWFRPHALRTRDNEALREAILKASDETTSRLHFVYLWDRASGGYYTASDVFLVHALDSLNRTLKGRLEVVDATSTTEQGGDTDNNNQRQQGHYGEDAAVDALSEYARKINGSTTDIFYLETFDPGLEQRVRQKLSTNIQSSSSSPDDSDYQEVTIQSFGKSQTLLDYSSNDMAERMIREAIYKHPFASPLLPFVDMVVETLEGSITTERNKEDDMISTLISPLSSPTTTDHLLVATNGLPQPQPKILIQDLVKQVGITRQTDWGSSIAQRWPATEDAASDAVTDFVVSQYSSLLASSTEHDNNNINSNQKQQQKISKKKRPNHLASFLSPYLARGLVSSRQVYEALQTQQQQSALSLSESGSNSFLRRLAWRDYAYAASLAFPAAVPDKKPIRSGYDTQPPVHDVETTQRLLQHWKNGSTGFPLVDAGMRQLVQEGFMPQQVRLAASACLVEGLNVPWELGMGHFEEYLVDYDAVINTHMWMNAGNVGLDPYYIGLDYKKRPYWDADGNYVRTWCPELEALPDRLEIPPVVPGTGGTNKVDALYTPWKAPPETLQEANVFLGDTYPDRIVDEREGRRTFLQMLRTCRSAWPASKIDDSGNDMISLGDEPIGAFTPRSLKF